jgi:hypothetical protein
MKPLHKCPKCSQEFSRKWNMREHCKTQHGHDPFPTSSLGNLRGVNLQTQKIIGSIDLPKLKVALDRLAMMMDPILKAEALKSGRPLTMNVSYFLSHPDIMINYLSDNYLILNKNEINGISWNVCKKCHRFEFRLIKHKGIDHTPYESHGCLRNMQDEVNKMIDTQRALREKEITRHAVDLTESLVRMVFGNIVYVTIESSMSPQFLDNFDSPLFEFEKVESSHWLASLINKSKFALSEVGLRNYIERLKGTYAVFIVKSGPYQGAHLVYLRRQNLGRRRKK